MLDKFRVRLSGFGPLAIRIALGVVFTVHGWPKMQALLAGRSPLSNLLADWPMSQHLAWAAGITEFVGGICLLLGLLTRFWAAGLVIQMAVAISAVHFHKGFMLTDGGYEYAFALGLTALALFLTGPGPISLDYLIGRLLRGQRANPVVGAAVHRPGQEPPADRPTTPPREQSAPPTA